MGENIGNLACAVHYLIRTPLHIHIVCVQTIDTVNDINNDIQQAAAAVDSNTFIWFSSPLYFSCCCSFVRSFHFDECVYNREQVKQNKQATVVENKKIGRATFRWCALHIRNRCKHHKQCVSTCCCDCPCRYTYTCEHMGLCF